MSYEGARFCSRCDEPILGGDVVRYERFSASGPGGVIEIHRTCPRAPRPRQTSPTPRHWSRG